MGYQKLVLSSNVILLLLKTIAYGFSTSNVLLALLLDSLIDCIFSVTILFDRIFGEKLSLLVANIVMLLSQAVPVAVSLLMTKIEYDMHLTTTGTAVSIACYVLTILVKIFLTYKGMKLTDLNSDKLIYEDQKFDLVTNGFGLLTQICSVFIKVNKDILFYDLTTTIVICLYGTAIWSYLLHRTLTSPDTDLRLPALTPSSNAPVSSRDTLCLSRRSPLHNADNRPIRGFDFLLRAGYKIMFNSHRFEFSSRGTIVDNWNGDEYQVTDMDVDFNQHPELYLLQLIKSNPFDDAVTKFILKAREGYILKLSNSSGLEHNQDLENTNPVIQEDSLLSDRPMC